MVIGSSIVGAKCLWCFRYERSVSQQEWGFLPSFTNRRITLIDLTERGESNHRLHRLHRFEGKRVPLAPAARQHLVSCPRNTKYIVAIKMGRQGGPSRTGGRREQI
jgi:hypothetical protein